MIRTFPEKEEVRVFFVLLGNSLLYRSCTEIWLLILHSDSTIKFILEKCIDFFKDMYADYSDYYDDDCNPEHLTVENVIGDYIEGVSINIEIPQNNDVLAYQIEFYCPIDCPVCVIRNNEILYIGENTDSSPWDNFDDAEKNYIKE